MVLVSRFHFLENKHSQGMRALLSVVWRLRQANQAVRPQFANHFTGGTHQVAVGIEHGSQLHTSLRRCCGRGAAVRGVQGETFHEFKQRALLRLRHCEVPVCRAQLQQNIVHNIVEAEAATQVTPREERVCEVKRQSFKSFHEEN